MPGKTLEQTTEQYAKQMIYQLGDFLVYAKDRTSRVKLFEDEVRKMNIIYHQVWFFRDKLIRNYSSQSEFAKYPKHLYKKHSKDAEQSVTLLLKKDDSFKDSVTVPEFLVKQIENVTKKLESHKIALEESHKPPENNFYITKEGDKYYYDRVPLALKVGSGYRLAFDILFDTTKGKAGVCTYDAFNKELQKRDSKLYKKLKLRTDENKKGLKEWSQDNLTVKSKGILSKVSKKDLIKTKQGVGFEFNNQK